MVTSEGGPGSISVAREASPSRWGGCTTGGGGANKHAGTASTEVIVVVVRGCMQRVGLPTAMIVGFESNLAGDVRQSQEQPSSLNGRHRLAHAPRPGSPGLNLQKKYDIEPCTPSTTSDYAYRWITFTI